MSKILTEEEMDSLWSDDTYPSLSSQISCFSKLHTDFLEALDNHVRPEMKNRQNDYDEEEKKLTSKELTNLLDKDDSNSLKKIADELWVENYIDRDGHKKYSIAESGCDLRLNLMSLSG